MPQTSVHDHSDPDAEEGGYTITPTSPALDSGITQGDTVEEAIPIAKDAIRGYLEALSKAGQPIPEERQHPQAITISVPA